MAAPLSARDVLVNREFGPMPGRSLSQEEIAKAEKSFSELTGSAKPDQVHTAFEAALSQQLAIIGEGFSSYAFVAAEMELAKGNVKGGLAHFLRAVELVEQERGSFFDLRKRGTTAAAKNDVYERPALLLLRLNQDAEAFRLFELARARGLAELSNIGKDPSLSQDDLSAVATLLEIEARLSNTTRQFADRAVAAEDLPLDDPKLMQLANDEARQRGLTEQMQPLLARLAARPKPPLATRDDLLSAAAHANLPVLLYWTNDTAVIGWYVGPQGSKPLNIFLPLGVLREKVAAVRASSNKQGVDFDQTAARELYLFLIQPFADLLTSPGVLIVPQGPLANLPFEALVDPTSGRFLAERYSISYAPNATLALRALRQPARTPARLLAVFDPALAALSEEIDEVSAAMGADHVQVLGTEGLQRAALAAGLAGRGCAACARPRLVPERAAAVDSGSALAEGAQHCCPTCWPSAARLVARGVQRRRKRARRGHAVKRDLRHPVGLVGCWCRYGCVVALEGSVYQQCDLDGALLPGVGGWKHARASCHRCDARDAGVARNGSSLLLGRHAGHRRLIMAGEAQAPGARPKPTPSVGTPHASPYKDAGQTAPGATSPPGGGAATVSISRVSWPHLRSARSLISHTWRSALTNYRHQARLVAEGRQRV
jgi:CHAT domain-containing protein